MNAVLLPKVLGDFIASRINVRKHPDLSPSRLSGKENCQSHIIDVENTYTKGCLYDCASRPIIAYRGEGRRAWFYGMFDVAME